jgi:outer membrane protein assembly factor BamE
LPLAFAGVFLGGCQTLGTYMPMMQSFGVYKLDINQGNYLSQDMVDKLKVGQSQQQVKTILGTPLIASVFRPDRWDYVYEFKRGGQPVEHRNFTVYFVDGKLARWEGDEMPQSVADLNRGAGSKSLPREPSAEDRGFFAWFWDIFKK